MMVTGRLFAACCIIFLFVFVNGKPTILIRSKRDSFKITIGCSSGYALSALSGNVSAYFTTDSAVDAEVSCTEVSTGSSETCSTHSRFYLNLKQVEYEHFLVDCYPNKYLQGFHVSLADYTGPLILNYTCCKSVSSSVDVDTCLKIKLDEDLSLSDLEPYVTGKIISQIEYLQDKLDREWYIDVRLCSLESSDTDDAAAVDSTGNATETTAASETVQATTASAVVDNATESETEAAGANATTAASTSANETATTTEAPESGTDSANITTTDAPEAANVTTTDASESGTESANVTTTEAPESATESSNITATEVSESGTESANVTTTEAPESGTESANITATETPESANITTESTDVDTTAASNVTGAASLDEAEVTTQASANVTTNVTTDAEDTTAAITDSGAGATDGVTGAAEANATTASSADVESTAANDSATTAYPGTTDVASNETTKAASVGSVDVTAEITLLNDTEATTAGAEGTTYPGTTSATTTIAATTTQARNCYYRVYRSTTVKASRVRAKSFMKFTVESFTRCAHMCIDHAFCSSFVWIPKGKSDDDWTCEFSSYHGFEKTCLRAKKKITGDVKKIKVVQCYRCE